MTIVKLVFPSFAKKFSVVMVTTQVTCVCVCVILQILVRQNSPD